MKRLVFYLPLLLILLASCNLRENLLLPPDLSAADYLKGSKIESYANYLVKSSNDNSFLFIPKESIADSLINYNDEIIFRKVESFAARDSLAFQDSAQQLSSTYEFSILRSGAVTELFPAGAFAYIYTDLQQSSDPCYYVDFDYYLQARAIDPKFYSSSRAKVPVLSTGEFAIYSFGAEVEPSLQHSGNSRLHTLIVDASDRQLATNFPAAYLGAAGAISLSLAGDLSQSEQSTLQQYFPNASITSPVIRLQCQSPPGNELPVLRLGGASKGFFGKQWTYLSSVSAYSWPETDQDSGSANWWQENGNLFSFLKGSGSYFLLSPIDTQSEISIPLDGSVSQIFLQELWFDLNSLSLANTTMHLKLNPDYSPYYDSYFSGKPFTITGDHRLFEVSFQENGSPIISLPEGQYLEFGFRNTLPPSANDRLFYIYRDADQDFISYKTAGTAYDASHYFQSGNYLYSGLALSGAYLFGSATESASQQIPYLKNTLYLQSEYATISWQNNRKRSFSHIEIDHTPAMPSHPWLQGEPLSLGSSTALASASSYSGTDPQNTLPSGFKLSLPVSGSPQNVLLFATSPYPRLRNYQPDSSHTGSSFVMENDRLNIYPAYPGTLIAAEITTQESLPVRIFSTMSFLWKDIILNTYGTAADAQSSIITITEHTALTDPYGILTNQYTLSPISMAYAIAAASESDYASFEPMLFFKRNTRTQNLLIYESLSPYYRLYPYRESAQYDPWHFIIDSGYNGISLAYDGSYAAYTDLSPHSSISTFVANPPRDTVLSLYQAQLVIPAFFGGNTLPLDTTISLSKLGSVPGIANLLAAYSLGFQNSSGTAFLPNFYLVPGATQEPYIYLPVEDIDAIPSARMFFLDHLGQITELTRVESFTDNYAHEYRVLGNSFICTVPNPGIFYISSGN